MLSRIEGRRDDFLITPDGRHIGRLDPVFKGVGSTIVAAQIVQESYENVALLIERGPGYREEDGLAIVGELRKRLGPAVAIELRYPERIPRGPGGKFKAVIRNFVYA